jgi:hypothetical protein
LLLRIKIIDIIILRFPLFPLLPLLGILVIVIKQRLADCLPGRLLQIIDVLRDSKLLGSGGQGAFEAHDLLLRSHLRKSVQDALQLMSDELIVGLVVVA